MSPGTELLNNSFQFVDPQIRVLQNSVISEQVNGGNQFLTSPLIPTPTVICETYSMAKFSPFLVHEPQSLYDDQTQQYTYFSEYHPYSVIPDIGINEDEFFEYHLELDPPNTACITRATDPDTLDRAIATGTLDTLLSKANRWILQLYLYDLLERRDSLKQAYNYLQDFLLTYADSSVGKYYTLHSSLLDAFSVDSADTYSLTILQSSRDTLVLNGAKVDSLILMATDSAGYWMAMEDKSANLALVHALDSLIHDLDVLWLTTRDSALAGIRGLIRTLPLDVDFIPDLQFSLEYLIDRLLDPGSISAGRTDSLLTIASRCPDEAGIAQYFAYGLIGPCEDPAHYDPEINCAFSSAMNSPFVQDILTPVTGKISDVIHETLDPKNIGSMEVYPNPTHGELYVIWPEKKDVSLKIISAEGKLVYAAKVTGDLNGYHIPLALNAGIYVIISTDDLGQSAMSRIVVVR